jgi:hypothetical protein
LILTAITIGNGSTCEDAVQSTSDFWTKRKKNKEEKSEHAFSNCARHPNISYAG